jgi:hypothetical protein
MISKPENGKLQVRYTQAMKKQNCIAGDVIYVMHIFQIINILKYISWSYTLISIFGPQILFVVRLHV